MKVFKDDNIFSILSEAVSEGILVADENMDIVATNNPLGTMFGYEKEELLGKSINVLIPEKYRASHDKHFAVFFANPSKRKMAARRELFGIKKCGNEFPLEIGLNPFNIYGKTFVMALVMDTSARWESDKKIREMNEQLEEKIEVRTHELHETIEALKKEAELRQEAENKLKEALVKEKELNELKTKFLSLVSHEFKTPLSSILTSATLILKYMGNNKNEKMEKHLETIKNKVHYLNNILNDFLSIEKLDSGKVIYKYTTFNLSKVFNEVIYDANMLLKAGQKIIFPDNMDDFEMHTDEITLELMLSNLLRNAIKYSPENSSIEIKIKTDSDYMTFIFVDHGIGIPKEDQKHIFSRYFRAKNALLDQGTGIGLNIVKSHVENLGGKVSFISMEGKGTTFFLQLPYK